MTSAIEALSLAPEGRYRVERELGMGGMAIFDLKTFATIGVVKVTGVNPDAIWYGGRLNPPLAEPQC